MEFVKDFFDLSIFVNQIIRRERELILKKLEVDVPFLQKTLEFWQSDGMVGHSRNIIKA